MGIEGGVGDMWGSVQAWLLPNLEDELGELDDMHREFVATCEMCAPWKFMCLYEWCGNGCPPASRLGLFKAFVAKALWNFPTTAGLIDALRHRPTLRRLCGWETLGEVPSESTFSRAFAQFSEDELPQLVHDGMVKASYRDKIVGHVSIDGTAVKQREKAPPPKVKQEGKPDADAPKPGKRMRRAKMEPAPEPEPTRMESQLGRRLEENLADLPRGCDWGCKANSQGRTEKWKGGKLHLAVADGDVPVACILSSASMHDSQAAIPLMQMASERVVSFYDLADSAYDAAPIRKMSAMLGHVAIIDRNKRRGEYKEFAPAEKVRYRERSSAERVNSHLHDCHGGRTVRVKGHAKASAHYFFGILVIAAEQILGMLR